MSEELKSYYYDVSFCKTEGEKTFFVKIGAAFPTNKGRISVRLDALPAGEWDGRLTLFPHGDKTD